MIVLVGFMGSGKTTVGRLLAARLGLPFVDTDRAVEQEAGASVAEIFSIDGETRFRTLERAAIERTLAGPEAVVALGGGAVMDPSLRPLLQRQTCVLLDVGINEALSRIGDATSRPLLIEKDPPALKAERNSIYERVASITVDTSGRSPESIVDEIARLVGDGRDPSSDPRRVHVGTSSASYDVMIGAGLVEDAATHIAHTEPSEKAFVITHPSLEPLAGPLLESLEAMGLSTHFLSFAEGETSKTLETVRSLYDALAELRAHRHDLVVTFGGGVVGDVGGFVASTYVRGMPLVHMPTTLLAQVDAAIGGKTGVNLAHGKNLVGTIYQPKAVLCDVSLLEHCPVEEMRSGMAEVIKAGFIADPPILDLVSRHAASLAELDTDVLVDLVARSVAVKAAVVTADEREEGRRAWLNYGHTFAHAIETVLGFGRIRHGEAVALGMMAAAYVAHELGRIDQGLVEQHRDVLSAAGLPVRIRLDLESLSRAWEQDKKYRQGTRFVLLAGPGKPEAGVEVPLQVLERALDRLAREDGAR